MKEKQRKKITILLAGSVLPLLVGAIFYYLFFPDIFFVKKIDEIIHTGFHISPEWNQNHIFRLLRFYLPDFLWACSFEGVLLIFADDAVFAKWCIYIPIVTGGVLEGLQFAHIVTGTGDFLDVCAEISGTAAAALFINKRRNIMKKMNKVLALVLCVCMFSVIALGSGSDSSSDKPTAEKVGEIESSIETAVSDAIKDATGDNKEEVKEEETLKDKYYVGDTLTQKGFSITYVSSGNYVSDNQFMQPEEGKKYIKLFFYADNQSDSDKSLTTFDFDCYADGYECDQKYFDEDALSLSLSSGRSGSGAVYFEVPEDAEEIEVEYEINFFSDAKAKFVFEGDKDSGFKPEKEVSASENAFHVGDILETDKIRITYLDAAEYKDYSSYFGPQDGYKYIYLELEIENISDSDHTISSFSFECYADGNNCSSYFGMDNDLSATLSAGRKTKGTVAFEVPVDAEIIEVEYEDNVWTEKKIIFAYEEK